MPGRIDGSIILNPGLLRHQITWQKKTVTGQNSFGTDDYTWTDVLPCRAQVRDLGGTELEKAMLRWPDAQILVVQHFVSGIDESMRIAWLKNGQTVYLDVLNISDPVNQGRYQNITCKNFGKTFKAA